MTLLRSLLLATITALAVPEGASAQSASASSEQLQAALARSGERTPTPLTMEDALQRALRDNLGLLAKVRELEAASFRAKAAIAPFIPVLKAGFNVTPDRRRNFSNDWQRWFVLGGTSGGYDVGLAFATPVGTAFTANWNQGLSDFALAWELEDGDIFESVLPDQEFKTRSANLSFGLNQSLLRGISPVHHLSGLWQAELAVDSADIQQEKEMTTVIGDLLKSYWDLVAARENLTIATQSRDLAEQQREVTQARIAAGDLAPIELLRIDETAATRSSEVLDAERGVEEADGRLKMVLGVSLGDDLAYAQLVPTDGVSMALPARTREGSLRIALDQNPDLRLAKTNLESKNIQWTADKHRQLPTLDFNASLGLNGSGNTDEEVFRDLGAATFPNATVGLQLTMPIPDVASLHQARATGADVEAALLQLQQSEREVLSGIEAALLSIRSFDKQVEVAGVRIELAARQAEAAEATYAVGRNTLRDVLEAQQALKSAQQAKIAAEVQALKARVDLEVLRGSLVDTLGVELQ
ncbi:MAG: TolC family protein [Deltaproteobacteria bacterium]|nr:TolC family protein [Deltaproteobacteria bacterium]